MHFYLRHSRHGNKVAISELEMAADLRQGWLQYNPDDPLPETEGEVANNLEGKRRRRSPEV
jgi:hypothetical protein